MWENEREKECFCEEEMGKRGLFLAAAAAFLLLLLLPFCCCKGEERESLWSLDEEREGIAK